MARKTTKAKTLAECPVPRPYLVGIGSSAGGLEALSSLISAFT